MTAVKLNPNNTYVTIYTDTTNQCRDLGYRLPSVECIKQPSVLTILKDGVYYIVKSRWEIKGDPSVRPNGEPVDPYELEFVQYTLNEVRALCRPGTGYRLPKGFIGKNVLIMIGGK